MNRADDRILWLPEGHQSTLHAGLLFHVCPQAVVISTQRRDQLDWMALGFCDACAEPLPGPQETPR